MRSRRLLSLLAIYVVALHTILWGAGIPYAGAGIDPFAVICHSEAGSPDQAPLGPASAPTKACDHCSLCTAMAPPDTGNGAVIARLSPPNLLEVLRPAIAVARDGIADNPNRARGPPSAA